MEHVTYFECNEELAISSIISILNGCKNLQHVEFFEKPKQPKLDNTEYYFVKAHDMKEIKGSKTLKSLIVCHSNYKNFNYWSRFIKESNNISFLEFRDHGVWKINQLKKLIGSW